MSSQTAMNNREPSTDNRGSSRSVVGNAADVVHDVTELAELQGKLFIADLKSTGRRAALPIGLLIVGLCVLLGLVPILLLGVAEVLIDKAHLTRPMALLASAGCGIAFCVLSFVSGWLLLRNSFGELANSRNELKRNLSWVKHALRNAGSNSRNG